MTQIKEATAYHKYLMQENEGDIQRIANQICMDIMDYNNPQAFELMDATGDRAFCDETLKKAAQIVIDLCTPVENKEVLVVGKEAISGEQGKGDDTILSDITVRQNLKDAQHWIEQARLSYFQHKDKNHFKKSLEFARKYIDACK